MGIYHKSFTVLPLYKHIKVSLKAMAAMRGTCSQSDYTSLQLALQRQLLSENREDAMNHYICALHMMN